MHLGISRAPPPRAAPPVRDDSQTLPVHRNLKVGRHFPGMEQRSPNRTETEALAAQSAAAVRALRDRAQRVLDERGKRLTELEERIAAQLEIVGEELGRDTSTPLPTPSTEELESLELERSQLEQEKTEWVTLRQQQEAKLLAARQEIEERSSSLTSEAAALEATKVELARSQAQLAADRNQAESQLQAIQRERAELEAAVAHFRTEQESTGQGGREELNQLERQLENERTGWRSERKQLEAAARAQIHEVEGLRLELDKAERRQLDLIESAKSDEVSVRNEMEAQAAAWQHERAQLKEERDTLADELQGIRRKLDRSLQQESSASKGLGEVVAKFELAMEDVRRLRGRLAELEQELEARPTADLSELPELIHLRSEREQLVEKVQALELQLSKASPASSDQEVSDLRRRFEMAVEDVRQLKTEKAKLEEQLASSRRSPALVADPSSSDWAAQKLRLLASLEGEEPTTPERRKELTSIEGTIRITDEVVADKDRTIEALQQRLEEAGSRSSDEHVVDSDELICAERERLAALESEVNEKLRTAELELSTSRAKLARQEAELEKLRGDLEVFKQAGLVPNTGGGTPSPPRRRWLDKLGLGGDEG
jgi:chromosome segregation ATPase